MAATLTSWGTDGSLALSAPLSRSAPRGDRRRGLALVPPVSAPQRPARPVSTPVQASRRPLRGAAGGTVHVTRAGRLAMSILIATLLAGGIALGVAVVNHPVAAAVAPTAPALPTIVVHEGQTLSEIAHDHLPSLPVHQGVVALQQANGLSTDRIMIGQRLVIPPG